MNKTEARRIASDIMDGRGPDSGTKWVPKDFDEAMLAEELIDVTVSAVLLGVIGQELLDHLVSSHSGFQDIYHGMLAAGFTTDDFVRSRLKIIYERAGVPFPLGDGPSIGAPNGSH